MKLRFYLALFAGVAMLATVSQAGSLGARVWWASYDVSGSSSQGDQDVDLGSAPMYLLQLDGSFSERVSGSLMLGVGKGWEYEHLQAGAEQDISRVDFLAGLSWQFDYMYIGAAAHAVGVKLDNKWDDGTSSTMERVFFGPELLVGSSFPLIQDTLLIRGAASVLPVVGVAANFDNADGSSESISTTTWGYSLDGGLVAVLSNWRLGAGYRLFSIQEYELKYSDGSTEKLTDKFGGPYVMAAVTW